MAVKKRRSKLEITALRELQAHLRNAGQQIRAARRRRGWIQKELGRRAELSQQTVSQLERGDGATLSLAAWKRVCLVVGVRFEIKLGRDSLELPADAGHLAIQEFMLRLGRATGYDRTFELPTKSSDPSRSTDVGLVNHSKRRLVRIECVNTFGDIGAAVRSSDRKQREAEGLAIALGHGAPYTVHEVWVVRDTRRNRALVSRYPEIFAARFPAPSRAWTRALSTGIEPPGDAGLVWCDSNATRLYEWRRSRTG